MMERTTSKGRGTGLGGGRARLGMFREGWGVVRSNDTSCSIVFEEGAGKTQEATTGMEERRGRTPRETAKKESRKPMGGGREEASGRWGEGGCAFYTETRPLEQISDP